jgi:hypothetical protein
VLVSIRIHGFIARVASFISPHPPSVCVAAPVNPIRPRLHVLEVALQDGGQRDVTRLKQMTMWRRRREGEADEERGQVQRTNSYKFVSECVKDVSIDSTHVQKHPHLQSTPPAPPHFPSISYHIVSQCKTL